MNLKLDKTKIEELVAILAKRETPFNDNLERVCVKIILNEKKWIDKLPGPVYDIVGRIEANDMIAISDAYWELVREGYMAPGKIITEKNRGGLYIQNEIKSETLFHVGFPFVHLTKKGIESFGEPEMFKPKWDPHRAGLPPE
nr:hypothetical protein [Candidatus Sigynarchaeota archaeon]